MLDDFYYGPSDSQSDYLKENEEKDNKKTKRIL